MSSSDSDTSTNTSFSSESETRSSSPSSDSSLPNSGPSLDELCRLLADSLGDALQPQHCAQCLTRCITLIEQKKGWRGSTRENNHTFWQTITTFLCSPRTSSEFGVMKTRLLTCECDMDDAIVKLLHTPDERDGTRKKKKKKSAPTSSSSTFSTFAESIFGLLHACLAKVDFIKLCKATGLKPLKIWPTLPSDLLPFDGERVVDTLVSWISRMQQPVAACAVLGRIALNTRSLTRPYLMSPKIAHPLWKTILDVASPIIDTNSKLPTKQKRRIVDYLEDFLESVLTFWATDSIISDFFHSRPLDALQMCSNAIAISYPSSNFAKSGLEEGSASNFALIGVFLFDSLQRHPRPPPLKSLHIELQKHYEREHDTSPVNSYFMTLYQIFRFRTRDQECAAIGCHMKAESAPQNTLRQCARCRCMVYCSQDCQTKAWKHPLLPHRNACKDLAALTPYYDGLKDGQVRKIAKRCVDDGVDGELMRRVESHVFMLKGLKEFDDLQLNKN